MKKVISSCIYCGCGCKLNYHIENNKIIKISGVPSDDISDGKPCIKGLTINEVFNKNRITSPYIRKNNKLVKATWTQAIDKIYQKVKKTNPKDIFLNGSGKITNEDNLLIYKLGTELFKTNNMDSCCGRLCHISTVQGVNDCLGASNLTKISNLDKLDTLFIIGSNPAVTYPVFWNKILKRKKNLKIISAQPLLNLTSKFGDVFLEVEPGSEVALMNGILNYLIQKKSFDKNAKKINGYKKLETTVKKYTPKYVSEICGIKEKDFLKACEILSKSKTLGVFHGMNFTQHLNSMGNIHSLLNLVLLQNAHIMTLRGEINVQGSGDIFAADTKILNKLWKTKLQKPNGNLVKALLLEPCKVAFLTEFNPAQSMPDLNNVHKTLRKIFIVYLGPYFNITSKFADVILPIPALFESNGTITNGEQRIRNVDPVIKIKNPDLLKITQLLAKKFNKPELFNYKDQKEIFKEITQAIPSYNDMNPDKVYSGEDVFAKKEIKHKKFFPEKYLGKECETTKEYCLILTTFRDMQQFLTSEITGQSKTLTRLDEDKCHAYINKKDATKFKIKDKDKIKISSKNGQIQAIARISEKTSEGIIATRFHYPEMLVNLLYPPKFDKQTYTPNYKSCAVKIEKIN